MIATPINPIPGNAESGERGHIPRGENSERWHKLGGISEPLGTEQIRAPGVRMCLVWDWGTHLELKRLKVEPEAQGQGIGSAMLRQLQARGKRIVLNPVSDEGRQQELERFYARAGFVVDFFDSEQLVWEPPCPLRR